MACAFAERKNSATEDHRATNANTTPNRRPLKWSGSPFRAPEGSKIIAQGLE